MATTQKQTIRIRAKSTLLDGKGAIMQLRIDGKVVGEVEVTSTSLMTYAFKVNLPVGSESKLDVVFTNAATSGTTSRTLYVDKLQVGNYVMRPVDPGVSYDRGSGAAAFDGRSVLTGRRNLTSSGALRFTVPNMITGTTAAETLTGTAGNDVLDGGAGNDSLYGGTGNNSYLFGKGDGNDTLYDAKGNNGLVFKAGITKSDIDISRDNTTLVFKIKSTGETFTVSEWFANRDKLTSVAFYDGSVLDLAAIGNALSPIRGGAGNDKLQSGSGNTILDGGDGDDQLNGAWGNDILIGGKGNDTLNGAWGNDILDGGAGNDTLDGAWDDDLYLFGKGDGQDYIADNRGSNRLQFKNGIGIDDLEYTRNSSGLTISIKGTTDSIRIGSWPAWHSIALADGTELDLAAITKKVSVINGDDNNNIINGFESNDSLYGFAGNDTLYGGLGDDLLDGGKGNDYLYGQEGNDTYLFGFGDGNDTLDDDTGNNRLIFKSGVTAADVISFRDNESVVFLLSSGDKIKVVDLLSTSFYPGRLNSVEFADGSKLDLNMVLQEARTTRGNEQGNIIYGTWGINNILLGLAGNDKLIGSWSDDQLDGGSGDDELDGGEGSDTYLFGLGDGKDTIKNDDYTDILRFKAGVSSSDISSSRNGDDLVLAIKGSSDQVTISDWFTASQFRLAKVEFTDGGALDLQAIDYQLRQLKGDEQDNQISSSDAADYLYGLGGNDTLSGGAGNDFLSGGTGNDTLIGGSGDDTYYFTRGDGQDRIQVLAPDMATEDSNNDTLQFAAGISADDLTYQRQAQDLVIGIRDSQDQITVSNWFLGKDNQLAAIRLADGSIVDTKAVEQELITLRGTVGDDLLQGLEGDDVLLGLAGNDVLIGNAGNDLLDGGAGNDALIGGEGDDTYLFGYGDGKDVIHMNAYETADDGGKDTLRFKSGVRPEDVEYFYQQGSFASDGSYVDTGLVFRLKSTGEQVTLTDFFSNNGNVRLDAIEFADGGSLDPMQVMLDIISTGDRDQADYIYGDDMMSEILSGMGGDDQIFGRGGNDLLAGGTGNDQLYGGAGDDTYLFGKGDGSDTIFNQDASGNDTLRFMDGIEADQLWLQQSEDDLVVSLIGSDDKVTIDGWFANSQDWVTPTGNQLDQIRSGDGKTLLDSQVQNLVAAMSSLTPPAAGETSLSADYHSKLDAVIAASWK